MEGQIYGILQSIMSSPRDNSWWDETSKLFVNHEMSKENGLFTSPDLKSFVSEEDIKQRNAYPDKKKHTVDFNRVVDVIMHERQMEGEFKVGQEEATWIVPSEKDKPIVLCLIADPHFGSVRANAQLFREHLDIVESTPNMYAAFNGDDVDNFNATGKWASGMFENPTPPQLISRALAQKYKELDDKGKIGVLGFGNHNDFGFNGGQDWYESFLGRFKCPIFTTGGLLHITCGSQKYDMAMTHKYWGTSKLNPTNVCKRFLNFEHPDADIVFLAHTHQSEGLQFENGGKDRIAVIGGTYKDCDDFARKHGIGGRAGSPGWAVGLYPNERKMVLFRDLYEARKFLVK